MAYLKMLSHASKSSFLPILLVSSNRHFEELTKKVSLNLITNQKTKKF